MDRLLGSALTDITGLATYHNYLITFNPGYGSILAEFIGDAFYGSSSGIGELFIDYPLMADIAITNKASNYIPNYKDIITLTITATNKGQE